MTVPAPARARSADWLERAEKVMPGGVNSPVRAFRTVGGMAPFIASAKGARATTVDGDDLIDLVASWGALIFGHAHDEVTKAIQDAVAGGSSFGMPTTAEVELAELISHLVPSMEVVRLVNSGTEATASLLRLARAATGRETVVKFQGCYHGHSDSFLVDAGSGLATYGQPSSPGVPRATAAGTRVAMPVMSTARSISTTGRTMLPSPSSAANHSATTAGKAGCRLIGTFDASGEPELS